MIVLKGIGSYLNNNKNLYLIGGLILLVVGFVIIPFNMLGALSFAAAGYLFSRSNRYARGLTGERITVNLLNQLDNKYYLINDVIIPGVRGNIDHIVLSEKGLFILESKHYNKNVICRGDCWHKKSALGDKILKSASLQVKSNAIALNRFVRSREVLNKEFKFWIEAAVVITNKDCTLRLERPMVSVLRPEQLAHFIEDRDFERGFTKKELKTICNAILRINKNP